MKEVEEEVVVVVVAEAAAAAVENNKRKVEVEVEVVNNKAGVEEEENLKGMGGKGAEEAGEEE
jgi:hypothetical protein